MMYTLLEMDQLILSSMDSDEVNSISDTTESLQVANIIKTVYNDIISRVELPEQKTLFPLIGAADPTRPVLMTAPSNTVRIEWVKYNIETVESSNMAFTTMKSLSIEDFLNRSYQMAEDEDGVESLNLAISLVPIMYRSDRAPCSYTVLEDNTLIFDSHDVTVDTTLQGSKTVCWGTLEPTFSMSDTFVPALDSTQFSLLFNESKALAFAELKQVPHNKAEVNSKRGWVRLQRNKNKIDGPDYYHNSHLPNYGRK